MITTLASLGGINLYHCSWDDIVFNLISWMRDGESFKLFFLAFSTNMFLLLKEPLWDSPNYSRCSFQLHI